MGAAAAKGGKWRYIAVYAPAPLSPAVGADASGDGSVAHEKLSPTRQTGVFVVMSWGWCPSSDKGGAQVSTLVIGWGGQHLASSFQVAWEGNVVQHQPGTPLINDTRRGSVSLCR